MTFADRASGIRRFWAEPPPMLGAVALVALGGTARGVWEGSQDAAELGFWIALAFALWLAAGMVIALAGRTLTTREIELGRVYRACAVAAAPAVLLALRSAPLPPPVEPVLWTGAHLGITAAFVMAVRETLEVDLTRALLLSVATLTLAVLALLALQAWLMNPAAV